MFTFITVLLTLWLLLNVLAPYAVVVRSERISVGRLPQELLTLPQYRKVKFYMAKLSGGYGFSVWAPPHNLVVFDREFFARASPVLIRYVVAHELAHFSHNHHKWRWACIVSGAVLLPFVRRWFLKMEEEADVDAARRTGLCRTMFPELSGGH